MEEYKHKIVVVIDTRAVYIKVMKGNDVIEGMMSLPAGIEIVMALIDSIKLNYSIEINRFLAEKLILDIDSTPSKGGNTKVEIMGRELNTKPTSPKRITITYLEVQTAISNVVNLIINNIKVNIKHVVPLELQSVLEEQGIILDGEFARLDGLSYQLQEALGVKVAFSTYIKD